MPKAFYKIGIFSIPEEREAFQKKCLRHFFERICGTQTLKDRAAVFLCIRKFLAPRRIAKRFFERLSAGKSFLHGFYIEFAGILHAYGNMSLNMRDTKEMCIMWILLSVRCRIRKSWKGHGI